MSFPLISIDQFRKQAKGKPHPRLPAETGVFRAHVGETKAVADRPRTFRFCFSDGSVDRMGDTIDPAGWDLADFLKNPVALWAHDSSSPPIGRASNLMVEDQRLMGDIEFMSADISPFADTIFRMVEGGWLNAVSVGFLPKEYDWADDEDREWGMDFHLQSLLEISVVPVPALPSALVDARSKGIDTRPIVQWAERALDGGGKVIIPKAELERLRRAAKEPAMGRQRRAPRRRDADPMGENSPADGGAGIGNCGRPVENECGMKDPAECSIHGFGGAGAGDSESNEDKGMTQKELRRLIRRELTTALKAVRKEADDTSDEPGSVDAPDEPLVKCYGHIKAAHVFHKMAMGSHRKAMDLLSDIVGDEDKDEEDGDGDGDEGDTPRRPSDDDGDEEQKRLLAEIRRLRG